MIFLLSAFDAWLIRHQPIKKKIAFKFAFKIEVCKHIGNASY